MSEVDLEAVLREFRQRLQRIEERLQPQPTCYDFPAAAKRLGIGTTKLKELVSRGEIRTTTIGKRPMVSESEILRLATPDEDKPVVEARLREKLFRPVVRPRPPPKR